MRLIWTKFFFILSLFFLLFSWFLFPYVKYPLGYADLGREGNLRKDIYDSISNNNIYDIFLSERDNVKYVNTVPSENHSEIFTLFCFINSSDTFFFILFSSLFHLETYPEKLIIIFIIAGYMIFTLLSLGAKGSAVSTILGIDFKLTTWLDLQVSLKVSDLSIIYDFSTICDFDYYFERKITSGNSCASIDNFCIDWNFLLRHL